MTRVVVTGGSGFIGRTLLPTLAERGCEVLSLTRADAALPPDALVDKVRAWEPSAVVHLATHFVGQHSPSDIPALVLSNVEWATVVAEATSAAGAHLVTVGSAWQHFDGQDYDPVSLYAATKQAADVIVQYYERVHSLATTGVTLFDTYGPGDTRAKLVPALLQAARSGAEVSMSDGGQLIDLTFVSDVARGIADLALSPAAGHSWVLRSWQPVTIRDLVALVESVTGRAIDARWGARPSRPREMRTDWTFGSSPPGWQREVELPDGIRLCWEAGGA